MPTPCWQTASSAAVEPKCAGTRRPWRSAITAPWLRATVSRGRSSPGATIPLGAPERDGSAPGGDETAPRRPPSSPARGPATSASQPTSGAPIGVEPRKTTEYSAITRPRIVGSTAICSARVHARRERHATPRPAAPAPGSAAPASAPPRPAASTTPNSSDEPTSSLRGDAPARARGQRAGHRADAHRRRQQRVGRRGAVPGEVGQQRQQDLEVERDRPDQRHHQQRDQQLGRARARSAARSAPRRAPRAAGLGVCSSRGFIVRSAMNIARNENAFTRKHGAIPISAMIVPASAGPRMREEWTTTRVQRDRVDARGPARRSRPRTTAAPGCRSPAPSRAPAPAPAPSTARAAPEATSANSVSAGTASDSCVIGQQRAASAAGRRAGRPRRRTAGSGGTAGRRSARRATPDPVSFTISHISPTICIQLPVIEITWPVKYWR